jgi:hypothetical protein
VLTLENGIAHLAAAVDAPTVEIYSHLMPLAWAAPEGMSCWHVLRGDPREIDCEQAAGAVRSVLTRRSQ